MSEHDSEAEDGADQRIKDREKGIPGLCDDFHFSLVKKTDTHYTARCLHCTKQNNEHNAQLNQNSNLVRHLKRLHPDLHESYKNGQASKRAKKEVPPDNPDQNDVKRAILNFVVQGAHPISVVEEPGFQYLIRLASKKEFHSITRSTCTEELKAKYDEHVIQVKEELGKYKFVCTTCDIWSNRKRSFLGATAHAIDPDTLKRKSWAIAVLRFRGKHDHKNCAEKICEVHESVGLTKENYKKVTDCVTDNASNLKKAFRVFSKDKVEKPDDNTQKKEETEEESDSEGEDEEVEFPEVPEFAPDFERIGILESGDDDEEEEELNADNPYIQLCEELKRKNTRLPRQKKCLCHSLSLVCTTDLKKCKFKNKKLARRSFKKARKIWKKCNLASLGEKIKDIVKKSLTTPVETRWHSLHDALADLLSVNRDQLNQVTDLLDLLPFTDRELKFLDEYRIVLEPLAEGIKALEGQDYCYYGFVLPTLRNIYTDVMRMNRKTLELAKPLAVAVLNGLKKRFGDLLDQKDTPDSNDALLAMITLPKFKLRFVKKERKDKLIELLIQEAEDASVGPPVTPTSKSKEKGYFDRDSGDEDTFDTTQKKVSSEVYNYLADEDTDLSTLHRYPHVKQVFLKYNTTLPSSAAVERLFSFASLVLTARRGSLSDEIFAKLTLLKACYAYKGDEKYA